MTIDKIEKQVSQILAQAKDFQKQAERMTQQNEIKAREFLHEVFESGLTLLGRGLSTGRKVTESFVAETHRKVSKLKNFESHAEKGSKTPLKNGLAEAPRQEIAAVKTKPKHSKNKMIKSKKQRAHLTNTSRSH